MWIAHRLPGRTRLRFHPPGDRDVAAEIRRALGAVPGVLSVKVSARAGSALCFHDPALEPTGLERTLAEVLDRVAAAPPPRVPTTGSTVAREVAHVFQDANRRVLSATEGRVDLGTLATLGFLGAGGLQVAIQQKLPAPPWFNLAWWGFRTFVSLEMEAVRTSEAIGTSKEDDEDGSG